MLLLRHIQIIHRQSEGFKWCNLHWLSPKQQVLAVGCTRSDKCDCSKQEVPDRICLAECDEEKISQKYLWHEINTNHVDQVQPKTDAVRQADQE